LVLALAKRAATAVVAGGVIVALRAATAEKAGIGAEEGAIRSGGRTGEREGGRAKQVNAWI
jgi:hypothetical protein